MSAACHPGPQYTSAQAAERSTRRQGNERRHAGGTAYDEPCRALFEQHAVHGLAYGLRAHGQRQQAGDHLAHQFAGRLALHKGHHLHAEQCGENHQHEAAYRNNNIAGRRGRQCQRKAHGQDAQCAAKQQEMSTPDVQPLPQHPCQNPARKPSRRKGAL